MNQAPSQKLLDRFQKRKAAGLKDVKFYIGLPNETTLDAVCDEVNRVYDAIDSGAAVKARQWNDSNRPKAV